MQRINFANKQSRDDMGFLLGIPLFNYLALGIKNLDVRAFNFSTADNICLLDFDFRQAVLDQDMSAFNNGFTGTDNTVFVDVEFLVS